MTPSAFLPVTSQNVEQVAYTCEGGRQNGRHPDSWNRKRDRRSLKDEPETVFFKMQKPTSDQKGLGKNYTSFNMFLV